jgi:hypothetical protein
VQGGDRAAFNAAAVKVRAQYEAVLARRGEDGCDYDLRLVVVEPTMQAEEREATANA